MNCNFFLSYLWIYRSIGLDTDETLKEYFKNTKQQQKIVKKLSDIIMIPLVFVLVFICSLI